MISFSTKYSLMYALANQPYNSEIEDCTLDWTFEPESADYIHMRWLVGSVSDWQGLYEQAYRTLRPGGWIESYEGAAIMECDDGTVPEKSAMEQWGKIFINFGESIGRPFTVVADGIQSKAMRAAGFVDMEESSFKVWPALFSLNRVHVLFAVGSNL